MFQNDSSGNKHIKLGGSSEDNSGDSKAEVDASSVAASNKLGRQGGKPSSEQPPKQDYIHVRARRGQATDSHSLAERVNSLLFYCSIFPMYSNKLCLMVERCFLIITQAKSIVIC